jgi:hypothetical protein
MICNGDLSTAPDTVRAKEGPWRHQVEAGPLYREAESTLGPPRGCSREADPRGLRIIYAFPQGGVLHTRVSPAIEFSEQLLMLPGLDVHRARQLLQEAEVDAFGPAGCGIVWSALPEEGKSDRGGRELAYRGETCNCQGRVVYHNGSLISILFRTAC